MAAASEKGLTISGKAVHGVFEEPPISRWLLADTRSGWIWLVHHRGRYLLGAACGVVLNH